MASVHCDLHDVVSKRSVRGTVCVLTLLLIFASAVEQSIAANIDEAYCGFRAAANLFAVVKVDGAWTLQRTHPPLDAHSLTC